MQRVEQQHRVVSADEVDGHVDVTRCQCVAVATSGGDHGGAETLCNLRREVADAARRAVHQDFLALLDVRGVDEALPRGE